MRLISLAAAAAAVVLASSASAKEFVVNGDFEQVTLPTGVSLPTGVDSFEFGDTYKYGQAVTGWTSITAPGAGSGAFNVYFNSDHASAGSSPISPDTRYTSSEVQYLWGVPDGVSPDGPHFVALDGDVNARGNLSQTVNGLVVGQTYTLSFDWAVSQFADRDGQTTEQMEYSLGGVTFDTDVITNPSHDFQGWMTVTQTFTATSGSELLNFLSIGTPTGLPPVALLDGVSLTGPGVPEPAIWSMMLIGFGGLGALIRRRRQAQVAAEA